MAQEQAAKKELGAVVDSVDEVRRSFVLSVAVICRQFSTPVRAQVSTKQDSNVSDDDVTIGMEQAQVSRALAVKAIEEHGYAVPAATVITT
jgi:NACalpha-BTF3-like transcription factor